MPVNNIPVTSTLAEPTTAYFNNFFREETPTSPQVNDMLLGFFEALTSNKETAAILAGSVMMTSQQQNLNVMQLIQELKGKDREHINTYLTALLNMNRVNTSLLGVTNSPQPNQYVLRTIIT